MAKRTAKKSASSRGGEDGNSRKPAFRTGSASTNPDRALPSSQKQGFYRSRGTIKLLNLYKSKPAWLQQKGKNGSKRERVPHPTAPARIEPDRRWFGNVRVVDQTKLALFREELSKAVNDPYSVVLRRSRLPLSLLSAGGGEGKTLYSRAAFASGGQQRQQQQQEGSEAEKNVEEEAEGQQEEDEEEEEQAEVQQPRLSGSALLSLQPFVNTFGGKSQRKRPQLLAHTLASLARQGERRRERYMQGAGAAAAREGTQVLPDSSSRTQQDAAAAGEGAADAAAYERRQGKEDDEESARLPSEEIFKKGTSKRIWSELYKVVDASDVLVQVLDARDPLGTRCRRLEQYLRKHKQAKHIVFLLNKVDLIPAHVARLWVQLLSKEAPTLLFQAKRQERPAGKLQLFQLLRQYAQLMADKKHVSVGFIGYPNVGKSSIINALRNKQVCAAAPVPGHTRVWQYVALTKRLYLIDCPGVVPASEDISDSLKVLRGVVRPERIQCPEEHIDELLRRVQPDHLRARYGLPDSCVWGSAEDFLDMLAKKKGRLRRGGEPDISTTARIVLYDLQRGRLPYFVPPPSADGESRPATSAVAAAQDAAAAAPAGESAAPAGSDAAASTAGAAGASGADGEVTGTAAASEATVVATGLRGERQRKKRRAEATTDDLSAAGAAAEQAVATVAAGGATEEKGAKASGGGVKEGACAVEASKKRRRAVEQSIKATS